MLQWTAEDQLRPRPSLMQLEQYIVTPGKLEEPYRLYLLGAKTRDELGENEHSLRKLESVKKRPTLKIFC